MVECSGSQRQSIALSQVDRLEVVTHESRDSEGTVSYSYELQLKLVNGESHALRQWSSLGQAQEFARWLEGAAGVRFS